MAADCVVVDVFSVEYFGEYGFDGRWYQIGARYCAGEIHIARNDSAATPECRVYSESERPQPERAFGYGDYGVYFCLFHDGGCVYVHADDGATGLHDGINGSGCLHYQCRAGFGFRGAGA